MSNFEFIALNNLVQRVKVGFVGSIEKYYCDKEHGKLLLRTSNLSGAGIDFNDVKYITEDFYKRNQKSQLKKYDLLIARHGENGKADIYETDEPAQALNVVIVEPDFSKISPYLLRYFFELPYVHKQIKGDVGGSVQGVINTKQISDLIIPINHSLNYSKIENTLRILEQKIDNNNKIIGELAEMAKTIYDYWFLQFEFPNEEGKPYKSSSGKMVWNEELKREIPEGWKAIKLQDVFSFVKGKIPSITFDDSMEGVYPYITIDVANGGKSQYCFSNDMLVCNGEVIMVMDGAASGDIYIGNRGVLGSTFAMLKKKREDISDALIYIILSSRKSVYKKVNTGSTVPHANKKFIENMRAPVKDNMSSFSRVFDEIYKKIELAKRENQELTSLRDFLLPLLMNGQVSFKE